jgi:nitrous oxidase accessory protein
MRRAAILGVIAALANTAAAAESPPRPRACQEVPAGAALQPLLDSAEPGSALCLAPGDYSGPLSLTRAVELWGPREARVISRGTGSTIRVSAAFTSLAGFTIDGSGGRFERLDAAVLVEADDTRVEGLRITRALFGILVQRAERVRIAGNEVEGFASKTLGLRGDAIRLWEVRHSEVVDNRVADARDVVAWYAPDNVFRGNSIARGRYGLHFMYSHGCRVERNRFDANVVGVFVMYSSRVALEHNRLLHASGAAGMGIGVKESGKLAIRNNQIADNTVGLYLDASPFDPADENWIEGNLFALNDRAIVFHGRAEGNHLRGNALRENSVQVALEGGGDARAADWAGNYFDDYRGYDLDRDGVGDLPHEQRSLAGDWTHRAPAIAFFRGTPALALAEWLGATVPLFRPTTLLVDPTPRSRAEAVLAD